MERLPPSTGSGDARLASLAAIRQAASDTHVLDYLAAAYRHRYLALGVFLIVILFAVARNYMTTPMYRATARLIIELEDDQVGDLTGNAVLPGENYRDPEPYYQTQYRILKGRELARRTVRKLELAKVPEFNGTASNRTRLAEIVEGLKSKVGLGGPAPGTSGPVPEAILVANFLSRVAVVPDKSSRLVDVTFVSTSPEFAARAVNQLAREYVDSNADQRRHAVTSGLDRLEEELERQKGKVEDSERAMASYREEQNARLARGPPEHRRCAPESAERRRDQGQDHAGAERVALQPGEGARPGRADRQHSGDPAEPVHPVAQDRRWPIWSATGPTCPSGTVTAIPRSSRSTPASRMPRASSISSWPRRSTPSE